MIKIGVGLGSRYFSAKNASGPALSYLISLGYGENQDYSACYAGLGTYYTNTISLQVGSFLYFDSEMTLIAPHGYYSDTVNLYVVGFEGMVTNRTNGFCNP